MTNGIEGLLDVRAHTAWDNEYLTNLFRFEWRKTESPAGALQWTPVDPDAPKTPDAHIEGEKHELMMMTSDIALKEDPAYREVCERFLNDFDYFADAFARAWYKLTHRDMGPKERYLGPEVPEVSLPWQDPIPLARSRARGRCRHRGPEEEDSRQRSVGPGTGLGCLGLGLDLPRHRQAWRCERRACATRASEGAGRSTARPGWRRRSARLRASGPSSTAPTSRLEGTARRSRWPT